MVGETEFDVAVRICNPPPAGPGKTRNQSPLGRFQHVPVRLEAARANPPAARPTGSSSTTRRRLQSAVRQRRTGVDYRPRRRQHYHPPD
jgi:hypothetical protein